MFIIEGCIIYNFLFTFILCFVIGGPGSGYLKEVVLKVVSNAKCDPHYYGYITDKMICAGGSAEGGKDSCQVFY